MLKTIKKFLKEEVGAETMEYIAIAAVVITLGVAGYEAGSIEDVILAGLGAITDVITG